MENNRDIEENKMNRLTSKKFDIGLEKNIKNYLYKQYSGNGYFLPKYKSPCITNATLLALQDSRFSVPKIADIENDENEPIKLCFSPYLTWEKIQELSIKKTNKYLPFYATPPKYYIKKLLVYFDKQNKENFFYRENLDEEKIRYINDGDEFDIILHSSANFQNNYYKRILKSYEKIKRKMHSAFIEETHIKVEFDLFKDNLGKIFEVLSPQDCLSFKNTDFFENFLLIENAMLNNRDFRQDELKKILNVIFDFDMSVIVDVMEIKKKQQLKEDKYRRGFFYDQAIGKEHFKNVNLFEAYKKNGYYFFEKLMTDERLVDLTNVQKNQIDNIIKDIDKNVKTIKDERINYLEKKFEALDKNLIKERGKSIEKIESSFKKLFDRLNKASTYSELKSVIETIDYFIFMIQDFTYKKKPIVLTHLEKIKKRFTVKVEKIEKFDIDAEIDGKSAMSFEDRSENENEEEIMSDFEIEDFGGAHGEFRAEPRSERIAESEDDFSDDLNDDPTKNRFKK